MDLKSKFRKTTKFFLLKFLDKITHHQSASLPKFLRMYERSQSVELSFLREQFPFLIRINYDYVWVPTDLLRFLWHTRAYLPSSTTLEFFLETDHYNWIKRHLSFGDIVLDCGTNMGLFSLMMAERVGPKGQVHSFEPSPAIYRDALRVFQLNEAKNITLNNVAVGEVCGEADFCDIQEGDVRREGSGFSLLKNTKSDLDHITIRVPTITIDEYIKKHAIFPKLIKIDVEGAEFLVLEGAKKCLATKPLLVIETHPDDRGVFDEQRLESYLNNYGYIYQKMGKIYYCK